VGSSDLHALSTARDLFLEISAAPKDAPAWVATCEHAAAGACRKAIAAGPRTSLNGD
jgi:hypothetical protein